MCMQPAMIKISVATDAIDAAVVTKDEAVSRFAKRSKLPIYGLAAIGDSSNDLPFLELNGLLLAGCPANAQTRVKRALASKKNGFISTSTYLDGFMDFYERAAALGARVVISDRDGVLLSETGELDKSRICDLLGRIGINNRPMLKILTGSSYSQNACLLVDSGIPEVAANNLALVSDPFLILAENGSVPINVITREQRLDVDIAALEPTIQLMRGRFLRALIEELKRSVLGRFGLELTCDANPRADKVYIPQKNTMVTVDVPRVCGADTRFRTSPESDLFRDAVVEAMRKCAEASGLLIHLI